jgi:hypothetical protein
MLDRVIGGGQTGADQAGSRESRGPGIGEWVERFMLVVFRRVAR